MNDRQQGPPLEAHRGWKEPRFKMHPSWEALELSAIGDSVHDFYAVSRVSLTEHWKLTATTILSSYYASTYTFQ